MNAATSPEPDNSDFVEVDPTGRYGRYDEILGKGASKTVYRAFDEYEGIEVAWNQVKLYDFLRSPEDLERLYCEIHLLKTLKHSNIMKFYTSWVDTANRNINFVTEMFTSGTLRQYRLKHKKVNIRAVKHWCRQILKGLLYLHSRNPPVIHRDLKCDNIFVNGNQGEVKIGDLGLAAVLRKSHAARCVGTPEFMAPEIYAEEYNELVDIYSFGMSILEMVTFEYPYSECTHPAQIYKKVVSGKKPEALFKVKDPEVRNFVEKCLATVSLRLPAKELLQDPFLQIDDYGFDVKPLEYYQDFAEGTPILRQPFLEMHSNNTSLLNGYSSYHQHDTKNSLNYQPVEFEANEIDLFTGHQEDSERSANFDITIKGRKRKDDGIFLRLRISDKEGRIRNIYFPFDIETDTAVSVATEMVSELDITDQEVTKIANMIDGEIASLVPEWKRRLSIEASGTCTSTSHCHSCASNGYLMDYVSLNSPGAKNLQVLQCSRRGCPAVHGRFEEITYQFEGHEQRFTQCPQVLSRQSDDVHYTDIWAQHDGAEATLSLSVDNHLDHENKPFEGSTLEKEEKIIEVDECNASNASANPSPAHALVDDYENEIRQELRWLKAKYQIQLRELRDQQLEVALKITNLTLNSKDNEQQKSKVSLVPPILKVDKDEPLLLKPLASGKHLASYFPADGENKWDNQMAIQDYEATYVSCSPENMMTAKSFYAGAALFPHSLHRASSLPVDAVDF